MGTETEVILEQNPRMSWALVLLRFQERDLILILCPWHDI